MLLRLINCRFIIIIIIITKDITTPQVWLMWQGQITDNTL